MRPSAPGPSDDPDEVMRTLAIMDEETNPDPRTGKIRSVISTLEPSNQMTTLSSERTVTPRMSTSTLTPTNRTVNGSGSSSSNGGSSNGSSGSSRSIIHGNSNSGGDQQ